MATTETLQGPTVELFFDEDEDHCAYDGVAILNSLDAATRAAVEEVISDPSDLGTTTGLYSAVYELDELGHDDVAEALNRYNHAEAIYACECPEKAYEKFTAKVDRALGDVIGRYPSVVWWADARIYAYRMDLDDLLDNLGSTFRRKENRTIRFTLDPLGNGWLVTDQTTTQIVSFPTAELGSFVHRLDMGAFDGDDGRDRFDAWFELPTAVRELMASVHYHDPDISGPLLGKHDSTTGSDLSFEQLQQVAETIADLPAGVRTAVRALLPAASAPLEELIDAASTAAA